jgi:hypothetical protein
VDAEAVYESWVPPGGAWSLWARPVLFAQMGDAGSEAGEVPAPGAWSNLDVRWAPDVGTGTVLVIDLPGEESVWTGLVLAGRGYRPVPLYNACTGPHEVIDQGPIIAALRAGAPYLRSLALAPGAPPAFLLDSRRTIVEREVRPGAFDNRWQVFRQDFPSAQTLAERGFTQVLLVQRGRRLREDLADVLHGWQGAGVALLMKDVSGEMPPAPLRLENLPWYRAAWFRLLERLGLRGSPPGGFGHLVPEPSHG